MLYRSLPCSLLSSVCERHLRIPTRWRGHSTDVRVRFAPSPTGMLHLGGLRTALYNFLFARSRGGSFILRIEDTDQTRAVSGAVEKLRSILKWGGIQIDEGSTEGGKYGPYVQSHRKEIYLEKIKGLLQSGHAYHCFCTTRRLELLRKDALRRREIPKYDGRCRHLTESQVQEKLSQGQPHVIRFKLRPYKKSWNDMILGSISHDVADVEGDPVLMKSDKLPTYHFANVVDDHMMKISHVLRGQEWMVSTTKHLLLYEAFDWSPPVYGHLPLILNKDGSKLSKRQNDIHVEHFRDRGYLPEAVISFLSTMGGGFHEKDTSTFSMNQLIESFDINRVISHPSHLDLERALQINKLHLSRQIAHEPDRSTHIECIREMVVTQYASRMTDDELRRDILSEAYIGNVLDWAKDRVYILEDLMKKEFEFAWLPPSDLANFDLKNIGLDVEEVVQKISDEVLLWPDEGFTRETTAEKLKVFSKENRYKYGSFMKLMRAMISGAKEGPSVPEMICVLRKNGTLTRLNHGLNLFLSQL